MTLQEKIDSIDFSKISKPEQIKSFIEKVKAKSKSSMTEAQALMDGIILKVQEKYPDAIQKKIAEEKAKNVISKLKKLKNIVPRKADFSKIADQIQKQQPNFSRQQAEELAKLRIEAQIARSTSFNDMIDVLSKSNFYTGRLSTAPIDKGKMRDLQKDASKNAITEADELKMSKKGVQPKKYKRISKAGHKNQYGTTSGGNVYYEYRDNRRDVDSKIRLARGGMAEMPEGRFAKKFAKGSKIENEGLKGTTYIPKRLIKAVTTINGNVIKGTSLKDGVYTTRKNIKLEPKIDRFMFEDEMYEYKNGGGVNRYDDGGRVDLFSMSKLINNRGQISEMVIAENVSVDEFNKLFSDKGYRKVNDNSLVGFYFAKPNGDTIQLIPSFHKKGEIIKYANGGGVDKFALGDVISSDDTPKVWVGEWSLYNEGRLIGEWVDLSNFDSGAEVMAYIQSLLDKWTKQTGKLREEYAIFDYENFPSNLYSEGMGEASFDKVIRAYKFSVENDVPMEVVGEIISEYDIDDLEEWFGERYAGQFDSDTDLAYWYVDEMLGGVENLDKRTQEMYFDYEAFGRDLAINDYRDINGYYFQTYRKGGMTMKNLNRYYKRK